MNGEEIRELAARGLFMGEPVRARVVETHVSWVLLARGFAFKIKKPVRFSFLDFGTLERRRHYCGREVELNRRLTDIYLDVVPICRDAGLLVLGGQAEPPLEYAVRMRRLDPAFDMGRMLARGQVTAGRIEELAHVLAAFHARAATVRRPFDTGRMQRDFDDLGSVTESIRRRLGADYAVVCQSAIDCGGAFLARSGALLDARVAGGCRRDLHGDFHAGNVFLAAPPVIFDCIEFNDGMREIDILDEVAFMCMDLEAAGRPDLAGHFAGAYLARMGLGLSDDERALFRYFKLYRAGVRAKVTALKDGNARDWAAVARYLDWIREQLAQAACTPRDRA